MARAASRRWIPSFGGLYCLFLAAGFAMGFSFGKPSAPPRKATVATTPPKTVAAASSKSTETTEPAPKAEPAPPKTPEPKLEPPVKNEEPKIEPPPPPPAPKKTEPKPEPKPTPKGSTLVTFDPKVKKIFADKCLNCHGGADMKGGLDLRSAASTIKGGDNGEAVKPGEPDDSPLWQSVSSGMMPPKGKGTLTADEKKLIRDWIAGGAK